MNIGKLYIVATPIGNLEDLTFRALRVLKEVDFILCEDTRVTSKLLSKYEIKKTLISFHHHTKSEKAEKIIAEIYQGKNAALVTDAGTPGVSDPGNAFVKQAIEKGIEAIPIPGASALSAIISVAGIDMQKFVFLGFPPHKKGRETFFKEVAASEYPVVYYESPHRIIKNLELLRTLDPQKRVIVGRELTKIFEETVRGELGSVILHYKRAVSTVKGEFSIIAF